MSVTIRRPASQTRNHFEEKRQRDKLLRHVTDEFRDHIGGKIAELARLIGVPETNATQWFRLGRISPAGAYLIGRKFPTWTKERLRPDILEWSTVNRTMRGGGNLPTIK